MKAQTKFKPVGICAIIATSTAAVVAFVVVMFILKLIL